MIFQGFHNQGNSNKPSVQLLAQQQQQQQQNAAHCVTDELAGACWHEGGVGHIRDEGGIGRRRDDGGVGRRMDEGGVGRRRDDGGVGRRRDEGGVGRIMDEGVVSKTASRQADRVPGCCCNCEGREGRCVRQHLHLCIGSIPAVGGIVALAWSLSSPSSTYATAGVTTLTSAHTLPPT